MIRTKGEKAFAVFNYLLLGMIAFMTVYPFWQIIITSISTPAEANRMAFKLWPRELSDAGYRNVLTNEYIWRGYLNTAVRLVLGTAIEMVLMILTAYPLSKKFLPFRNKFTMIIVFTMFFSGGLVPAYLNVRSLHIDDTVLALVLPTACKTFSMLIVRNFFMSIPNEIEESAKVDGAGSMRILVSIILPLSVSILLTVGLWSAVDHWNAWFDCLIYIRTPDKYVLQAILRKIVIDAAPQFDNLNATADSGMQVDTEVVKASSIVVSTLPILAIYPFVQKYFVQGVMVGSLKG